MIDFASFAGFIGQILVFIVALFIQAKRFVWFCFSLHRKLRKLEEQNV
jgi:hypothetical protein